MRHIPEDELHAYLDQGLSRSQCVEIESHLAGCGACQAARDSIAALRDRTTALLSRLAPPRSFPAPFETLRRRAAVEVSAHRRRVHRAAWAASIVAAVAFGWTANHMADSASLSRRAGRAPIAPVAVSRQASASDSRTPTATSVSVQPSRADSNPAKPRNPSGRSSRRVATTQTSQVALPPVVAPAELELSAVDMPTVKDF